MSKIEEKAREMEDKSRLVSALESIVSACESNMKWNCTHKKDEDGNEILDKNGEPILIPPTKEDRWEYYPYAANKLVIELIEKYVDKL